jgi:hypothetical protein
MAKVSPRGVSGATGLLIFFLFATTPQAAVVCTQADAARRIKQLGDQNATDEMSGNYPSAASARRDTVMRQLATQYCAVVDSTPQFDRSEHLDSFCTLLSGISSGSRLYWVYCRACGEVPGETCE